MKKFLLLCLIVWAPHNYAMESDSTNQAMAEEKKALDPSIPAADGTCHLSKVPDHVITTHILSFLSLQDLASLSHCSKQLYKPTKSLREKYKEIFNQLTKQENSPEEILRIAQRCPLEGDASLESVYKDNLFYKQSPNYVLTESITTNFIKKIKKSVEIESDKKNITIFCNLYRALVEQQQEDALMVTIQKKELLEHLSWPIIKAIIEKNGSNDESTLEKTMEIEEKDHRSVDDFAVKALQRLIDKAKEDQSLVEKLFNAVMYTPDENTLYGKPTGHLFYLNRPVIDGLIADLAYKFIPMFNGDHGDYATQQNFYFFIKALIAYDNKRSRNASIKESPLYKFFSKDRNLTCWYLAKEPSNDACSLLKKKEIRSLIAGLDKDKPEDLTIITYFKETFENKKNREKIKQKLQELNPNFEFEIKKEKQKKTTNEGDPKNKKRKTE